MRLVEKPSNYAVMISRLGRTAFYCYSVITVLVRGCITFFKWEGMVVEPEILGLVFYASGFVVTLTSICLPYCQPPLYISHPYRFVATLKPRYFYSRELLWHSARELLTFLLPLIDFNKINSILGDTRFSKRTKSKVSEMNTRGEIRSPSLQSSCV